MVGVVNDEGERLRAILDAASTLVVVGASRNPAKDAQAVPARMQQAGWRIIPVNPHGGEILGERVYPSVSEVPDPLEVVVVFRPSADAAQVTREAIAAGARVVWLQEGVVSAEARALADAAGVGFVEDRCVAVVRAMYAMTRPSRA